MPEQSLAAAAGCTCAASGTGNTKAQHAIARNRNFMKLRVHHFSVHLALEGEWCDLWAIYTSFCASFLDKIFAAA
jgi:hypothetical protein